MGQRDPVRAKPHFEQPAQQPGGMECAPVGAELQLRGVQAGVWTRGTAAWEERISGSRYRRSMR
jgi:hypothetical protein